jgi:hypothetical protein
LLLIREEFRGLRDGHFEHVADTSLSGAASADGDFTHVSTGAIPQK